MKNFKNSKKITLAAMFILGVASVTFRAQAHEVSGVDSRTVDYSDLNLHTAAGNKVLYQRIRNVAEQVCGNVDDKQIESARAAKACVAKAVISSFRAVNSLQLTKTAQANGFTMPTELHVASSH